MKFLYTIIFSFFIILTGHSQIQSYAQKQVELLEKALQQYKRHSIDDWMYFSCDSCIQKGDKSNLVNFLRKDLAITGDLRSDNASDKNLFDENIYNSLKKFQQRNGLYPDGILGSKTIDALNEPYQERVQQIKRAINQWIAFEDRMQEPYLLVNIPDYSIQLIDSGKVIHSFKVVIGKPSSPTPLLTSQIKYLVFNPSWIVPNSIAIKETLPMIQNDKEYLAKNHLEVYTIYKGNKIKINPDSIDWNNISSQKFNYIFEQTPGSWNALGELKFIFPNDQYIYLHDSQDKNLFNHTIRAYSHGCIRIENPIDLAALLLHISNKEVRKLISPDDKNKTITLSVPMNIIIDYFTTWVSEDNNLQFRDDIYRIYSELNF